jgi:hypothetical protein
MAREGCPKHMVMGPPSAASWTTPTRSRPAGVALAAEEARALLGIPGVAGVNISGPASSRGYEFAARVKAGLAQRIREEHAGAR